MTRCCDRGASLWRCASAAAAASALHSSPKRKTGVVRCGVLWCGVVWCGLSILAIWWQDFDEIKHSQQRVAM